MSSERVSFKVESSTLTEVTYFGTSLSSFSTVDFLDASGRAYSFAPGSSDSLDSSTMESMGSTEFAVPFSGALASLLLPSLSAALVCTILAPFFSVDSRDSHRAIISTSTGVSPIVKSVAKHSGALPLVQTPVTDFLLCLCLPAQRVSWQ